MDFSIEDLDAIRELNETDAEVSHIVSPTKEVSELDEKSKKKYIVALLDALSR